VKQYPDEFLTEGSHGRCQQLLVDAGLAEGVVLDLGCASGRLAEPVSELGLEYVGADIDRAELDELAARGFETHELDLSVGEDDLVTAIDALVGDRSLAAVVLLDVVEHLVDPVTTLRALGRLAAKHEGLSLVVSIPNATHLDVGIKLLLGRWDVTDTGLLDDTHVRFFNERLVGETLARAGWAEVAASDVILPFSDQLFPADAPALRPGTPLRQLLWRIRMAADPHGETYQFVRRFEHAPDRVAERRKEELDRYERDDAFLTLVVRASTSETGSIELLLRDVASQRNRDVEVLVTHSDRDELTVNVPEGLEDAVRIIETPSAVDWRDVAIGAARGRYIAMLDDRTQLSPRYVETIQRAAEALPGRVVQLGAVVAPSEAWGDDYENVVLDDVVEQLEPIDLDPLDLVGSSPFGSVSLEAHAVPRQVWATNGLRFDPDAGDASPTLFLLRAIELCGIVRSGERVVAVHPSVPRSLAGDIETLQKHLSLAPMVVPEGAGAQLLALRQAVASVIPERDALVDQLATAHDQIETLSWHLRHRDDELTQVSEEARVMRSRVMRRLTSRARRRLGTLLRRI
jgi:SAM-dependent methyltransferase